MTATEKLVCSICGGGHESDGNADARCGVYRWFPGGEVKAQDLRINLGLVMDLLRLGSCVVKGGKIKRRGQYSQTKSGLLEYREDRERMVAELVAAEAAAMEEAAGRILGRLGPTPDVALDYRTLSPVGGAMRRASIFRETFAESTNWPGGLGRMLDALTLMQCRVAADLAATADLSDRLVAEVNARGQRQRLMAVGAARQMVDAVADALWRCQYDEVQDIVDGMYGNLAREIGRIIGLDINEGRP